MCITFAGNQIFINMEIVSIERKVFESMLEDIASLTEKVGVLERKSRDRRMDKWLDTDEVCALLRISPRKLLMLRDRRLIACSQINRKFYYRPEEVGRVMEMLRLTGVECKMGRRRNDDAGGQSIDKRR